MSMPYSKKMPFAFVLDYLLSLAPVVKPMFGCYSVYLGEKIMLILRNRKDHPDCNGVWLATSREAHQSLKKDFPSMRSISIFTDGTAETTWQMHPLDADDFESSVIKACEFILQGDERIGRIPKQKKSKKRKQKS